MANLSSYHTLADEKQLYEKRYWKLLLHVKGNESEIDDPEFFISDTGKRDFKSELHATIDALYNEVTFDDNATACQYPARKAWLQEELLLENLPIVTCKAYDTLVEKIDPQSVTMVFADAHINSPASMFGHTFLRIDSSHDSKLLSHAINYSANADQKTENGVVFAIKGLFGGYPGIYSLLPYYEKLKEYKNTEQRDIWEYELNLTPDEVKRMVMHIWEIHNTYSWYYFFDENCSYHMLWLLEVARPSVHLREYFTYQVIPPETIFAIEKENLIEKRKFRPSKRSVLLAYEAKLSLREQNNAIAVALGNAKVDEVLENKSQEQQQYFLEAAAELCEYYFIENKIDKDNYLETFQDILRARAQLGKGSSLHVKVPTNPEMAHKSSRLRYQLASRNGYIEHYMGIRVAYQDIFDSDIGMLRGTQIEFFDLLLSYSADRLDYTNSPLAATEESHIDVEKLTIISLSSYAQRGSFFQPFSWRMSTGFNREYLDDKNHFNFTLGVGESWGSEWGYLYLMADTLFYYDDKDSTLGISPSLGFIVYEAKDFKFNAEYRYRLFYDGQRQHLFNASQLWQVQQNVGIKLGYDYIERFGENENRFKAGIDYYF
ncbi:MAG: DUF4105 domain-containing protein [Campylobacterota bacterium]|nr:DUF4105 domain-containing protein [Campylobacterota bacterium]